MLTARQFAKLRGLTSLWLDDNQFGALPEVMACPHDAYGC